MEFQRVETPNGSCQSHVQRGSEQSRPGRANRDASFVLNLSTSDAIPIDNEVPEKTGRSDLWSARSPRQAMRSSFGSLEEILLSFERFHSERSHSSQMLSVYSCRSLASEPHNRTEQARSQPWEWASALCQSGLK